MHQYCLLIESRVEVESDVSILPQQVEVEALGLLLDSAEYEQGLANSQSGCNSGL